MPYQRRSDLPEAVQEHLPAHAESIYKEAYNSAWKEYDHDEERAHRIAWGAVKKSYHKNADGKWVKGATDSGHQA
jgi:cation transport regulator